MEALKSSPIWTGPLAFPKIPFHFDHSTSDFEPRFREWPMEALKSVAHSFLADVEMEASGSHGDHERLVQGVVESCVFIHQSVERRSKRFFDELRRHNYVTPTSYLELLGTFIRCVLCVENVCVLCVCDGLRRHDYRMARPLAAWTF